MKKTVVKKSSFRERDARMSPAERAAVVFEMCKESTEVEVAGVLGISLSHLRNFKRLRAKLSPVAWEMFEKQGKAASIRAWLPLCTMTKGEQLRAARTITKSV